MTTVQEATRIILEHSRDFGTEAVPLSQAIGRVLRQDIMADRDFPPFNRVSMDGIAIRYEAFANGRRKFPVEGIQAAGGQQKKLQNPEACLEVMTGAVLPENSDTVIRYEDVVKENGSARLLVARIEKGQNAHPKGFDRRQDDCIVAVGTSISPAEVGVAASVGLSRLKVAQLPRVAIISTGDELVPVEQKPEPHQLRASNTHTIAGLLADWGILPAQHHIADSKEATQNRLAEYLEQCDVLLLSGGVSKGQFDHVPEALTTLGVRKFFHKVEQRPGKPFWFGQAPQGATVFALPGNPVAAMMCTVRYFQPWLRKCLGLEPFPEIFAALAADYKAKPQHTNFIQVKLAFSPATAQLSALPAEGHGSGDLANLAEADAFLELPPGNGIFEGGAVFRVWRYRGNA